MLVIADVMPACAEWLSGWPSRYPVSITENTGYTLNYHQVGEIGLQGNTPSGAGYVDFSIVTSQSLRVTDSDGITLLPYWIHAWHDDTNLASVWIREDTLTGGLSRMNYVYGGNISATSISSYSATMTKITDTTVQSCQGLWHMDEGTGDTVADSSGNGYNGIRTGSTKPVWQGVDGGQWDSINHKFDGDHLYFGGSGYVNIGNVLNMGTSDWTVEMWVYRPSGTGGRLLCKEYDDYGWWLSLHSSGSGNLAGGIRVSASNVAVGLGTPITPNAWHHIVWTIDRNDRMWLYVDNRVNDNHDIASYVSANITNNSNLHLGHRDFYDDLYFTGYIDEVAIYSRALSADEIQSHYYRRKHSVNQPTWVFGEMSLSWRYTPFKPLRNFRPFPWGMR